MAGSPPPDTPPGLGQQLTDGSLVNDVAEMVAVMPSIPEDGTSQYSKHPEGNTMEKLP